MYKIQNLTTFNHLSTEKGGGTKVTCGKHKVGLPGITHEYIRPYYRVYIEIGPCTLRYRNRKITWSAGGVRGGGGINLCYILLKIVKTEDRDGEPRERKMEEKLTLMLQNFVC